jgi:hypothetical protein
VREREGRSPLCKYADVQLFFLFFAHRRGDMSQRTTTTRNTLRRKTRKLEHFSLTLTHTTTKRHLTAALFYKRRGAYTKTVEKQRAAKDALPNTSTAHSASNAQR